METVVLASATKRDVTENDILHAIGRPLTVTDIEDDESGDWHMFVGPDLAARLIEVGLRIEDDTIVVFHAFRPPNQKYLSPER